MYLCTEYVSGIYICTFIYVPISSSSKCLSPGGVRHNLQDRGRAAAPASTPSYRKAAALSRRRQHSVRWYIHVITYIICMYILVDSHGLAEAAGRCRQTTAPSEHVRGQGANAVRSTYIIVHRYVGSSHGSLAWRMAPSGCKASGEATTNH